MRMEHLLSKQKGQAIIEYVILLALILAVGALFFQVDEGLKGKLIQVAYDLKEEDQTIPLVVEQIDPLNGVRLSPPVADFIVPSPNYKGRTVHFIDKSFDIDGVVEHYFWTITGNGINDTKTYNKFNEPIKGGMEYTFRYSGTYTISLIVVDNDGLVSNKVTKTIQVIDRSPTVVITATSSLGTVGSGQTLQVYQNCPVSFAVNYDDPDLPYDVLTLTSYFTDFSGTRTRFETLPQFERTFYNLGDHKYEVTVTDEDGMSAYGYVNIKVIAGNGSCNASQAPSPKNPTFTIKVENHAKYEAATKTYFFNVGTTAKISAVIDWKGLTPNTHPIYWNPSDWNNTADPQWGTFDNWGTIYRPYTTSGSNAKWETNSPDIRLCGMARTNQYIEKAPVPNLPNKTTNEDCVNLKVIGLPLDQQPVISVNNKYLTPPEDKVLNVNVRTADPANGVIEAGKYKAEVQSVNSYVLENGQKSTKQKIEGVRWAVPADQNGTLEMRPNPTKYPEDNQNTFMVTDDQGYTLYWYKGTAPAPGTNGGKTFVYGQGSGPLKNTWQYELRTIIKDGDKWVASPQNKTVSKHIVLKYENKPPVAVCSPSGEQPIRIKVNESILGKLSAVESTDPDGDDLFAYWFKDGQFHRKDLSTTVDLKWSTPGTYKVRMYVEDPQGAKSPEVECTVIVTAQSSPIDPEFWDIQYRVGFKGDPVKLRNKSVDSSNVVGKTQFTYTMVGGRDAESWKKNTPNDPNTGIKEIVMASYSCSDKGVGDARRTCNEKEVTYSINYVGAFTVALYVTDDSIAAKCSKDNKYPSGYKWTGKTNHGQGDYCKKTAPYFRMDHFRATHPITKKICTFETISEKHTEYHTYLEIFPNLDLETQKFVTRDNRTTTVPDEIKRLLNNPTSCY